MSAGSSGVTPSRAARQTAAKAGRSGSRSAATDRANAISAPPQTTWTAARSASSPTSGSRRSLLRRIQQHQRTEPGRGSGQLIPLGQRDAGRAEPRRVQHAGQHRLAADALGHHHQHVVAAGEQTRDGRDLCALAACVDQAA